MGTRADFYIGTDKNAEWLGSIAWDGYPDGIDGSVLGAGDEQEFRATVQAFLESRRDATFPKDGWPWPWDDSDTTDFAYAFKEGRVLASCFGRELHSPEWFMKDEEEQAKDEDAERPEWPNMKERKKVTFGERSGVMFIGG